LASSVCGCAGRATTGVAGVGGGHFGALPSGGPDGPDGRDVPDGPDGPDGPGESRSSLGHSTSVRPSWLADEYAVALEGALDAPLSLADGTTSSDQSNPLILFYFFISIISFIYLFISSFAWGPFLFFGDPRALAH
jgi:hypothetical protein